MSDVNQHIEDSLEKIRVLFKKSSDIIEALKGEAKIPATKLADDIAKEYGMKGPQLYPTLKFLFDSYPDSDITRGAHGGIRKIRATKDTDMLNHIELSLDKIRVIFKKACDRIEVLQGEEKIPATKLADDLAKDYGMKGPQLYPTLKFLLDKYPDATITRGAHGGIRKIRATKDSV